MKINYSKNPQILNNFLNYLINIKSYPITTINSYSSDLLLFFKFLKKYYNTSISIKDFNIFILLKVKEKDILAFLVYINYYKNNISSTRQRKLTTIRVFYNWLISLYPGSNIINPAQNIGNIEKIVKLPKYLNLEQARKMINIFNVSNSRHPIRDNTIIFLFLNTGIRISELSNLNIKDINLLDKYILIKGKGNKKRKVLINEKTVFCLKKYLIERNKNIKCININDPFFLNQKKERLGIDGISNICKKAYNLIGIKEDGYTAHTLRHTYATLLYQYSNIDILTIKEILGHSSVNATEIYTHIHNNLIKNAVDKNPLNNFAS